MLSPAFRAVPLAYLVGARSMRRRAVPGTVARPCLPSRADCAAGASPSRASTPAGCRPAARAAPLLLEEREVGARAAAAGRRRARVLGVGRLPQLRGPVARAALLERLTPRAPLHWRDATVREIVAESP